MTTVNIYQDNSLQKTFEGDNSQNEAFMWLLRNQGQSTDYAIRWGGWKVEVIDSETKEIEYWKPYSRRQA